MAEPEDPKAFAKRREAWLDTVFANTEIGAVALRLARHLARNYFRASTGGTCWPSQDRLAKELEIDERRLRRGIADLRDAGLLIVKIRRRNNNQYEMPLCRTDSSSKPDEFSRTESSSKVAESDEFRGQDRPALEDESVRSVRIDSSSLLEAQVEGMPGRNEAQGASPSPRTQLVESETTAGASRVCQVAASRKELEGWFALFMEHFPDRPSNGGKTGDEVRARAVFERVVRGRKATVYELVAAAFAYNVDQHDKDGTLSRMTMLPSNWLRGERWRAECDRLRETDSRDPERVAACSVRISIPGARKI